MFSWLTPTVRGWVYRVAVVALPLLVAYGALDANKVSPWVALLGAVLVPGVAAAHTPVRSPNDDAPPGES